MLTTLSVSYTIIQQALYLLSHLFNLEINFSLTNTNTYWVRERKMKPEIILQF